MSEFEDVEIITARDESREVEALVIPEGYVVCLMTVDEAARYAEWTDAVAVRVKVDDDGTFGFIQITDDMDWVTSSEADK